ncbi:Beta,beta-carotene 15,15'-monooxygenase [Bulinus truncatus]|nr:Beta,beta-carotene 15,15'-monooxygenase [Bulinus truncatus]
MLGVYSQGFDRWFGRGPGARRCITAENSFVAMEMSYSAARTGSCERSECERRYSIKDVHLTSMICFHRNFFSMSSANEIKLPQYFNLDSSADIKEPIDVPVTGQLPAWLSGSLCRNGSGIYRLNQTTWKHSFDGLAVLHRWTIKDGKVTYLSSVLDSDHYKKCVKYNRLVGGNFGTTFPDPCQSIFKRFFSHFIPMPPDKSDNTAVSLMQYADRLLALTETTIINEINLTTLHKNDQINLKNSLPIHMGTAHPHQEKDGSFVYYGTKMGRTSSYNFIRIPAPQAGESIFKGAKLLSSIPSRWKGGISYIHSFGITENYIVHFENPLVINACKLLTIHMKMKSIEECMASSHQDPLNIVVVSKQTGKKIPVTYLAPHGFVFHFINCYEDSDHIVCDVCLYGNGDIVKQLYLESLCDEERHITCNPYFARFILPLNVAQANKGDNLVKLDNTIATAKLRDIVKSEPVIEVTSDSVFGDNYMVELPRINYDFNTLRYRYMYGTSAFNRLPRRLMKFDVVEKKVLEWMCDQDHFPGEPVFVPGPDRNSEDDGVVLCPVVSSSAEHSSFLLVLDARTMEEVARATTPAELKMNYSFHGLFLGHPDAVSK